MPLVIDMLQKPNQPITSSTPGAGHLRFDHLDGLRGIAAVCVMIGHVRWPSAIASLPPFRNISLWVDFFFVLSGFVIAHAYLDRLKAGLGLGTFMVRRFARLYPLHLLTLLLAVAYEVAKAGLFKSVEVGAEKLPFQTNTFGAFLANLGLVQAMGLFPDVTWNGPSWSISVEFYTYLAVGFLFVTVRSQAVFRLLLAAIPIVALGILVTRPEGHYLSVETDYGFFRCLFGFGLGVIAQQCGPPISRVPRESADSVKAAVAFGVVMLIAMAPYKSPWGLIAPPLFAVFIWTLTRYRGGRIEAFLASPTSQWLGLLSYSIYLNHSVFRLAFRNVWRLGQKIPALKTGIGSYLFNEGLTLFYVAVVLLFSWGTYRWLEVPAQRWINRKWDALRPVNR